MPRSARPTNRTLRRRRRVTLRALLAAGVALLLLLAVTGTAAAADVRSGGTLTVPAGAVVSNDLYLFGGTVDLNGTVTRDATVFAGTLNVRGRVAGSLNTAVGDATIRGAIGHSVRAASGTIDIYGPVQGDVVVASGSVTIEPGARVQGDVVAAGGDVTILGPVLGRVRGSVDHLTINAPVGAVDVNVGTLQLKPKARVTGKLSYRGRDTLDRAPGASVTGQIVHQQPSRFLPTDNVVVWLGSAILRLLFALIAGVVIVLILPRASVAIADGVRGAPLRSFIVGVILLVLLPIAIVLAMITVIGIPIALLALAFYVAALYLSQVFVGLAIGRLILPNAWGDEGRGFNLLAMTIGVIVLAALRLIPVPHLDAIIAGLTAVFGLGAVIVGLNRGHRPRFPGWSAPPPSSPGPAF